MRTAIKDRTLTGYSTGEEIFNSVSHGVGAILAVVALVLCMVKGATAHDVWYVVSTAIYGGSMILLYTMSSIYHGLTHFTAKRVFQVFDHCAIFLLIAGTYTPLTLSILRPTHPVLAWIIFGIVWASALVGIVLNSIDLTYFSRISMVAYLAMGWCIVFAFKPLVEIMQPQGIRFLIYGGIAYTVGAILYGAAKRKFTFMHGVFHVFVLIGSIFHFLTIYLYGMAV